MSNHLQQTPFSIVNNKENMRFEIHIEDEVAYLEYRMYKKDIAFMHTFVPEKLGGRGLASSLAIHAFAYAKEHNLPVMVYCPYVAGFIKKYPEYKIQLDPQYYH
jgi:uncharacterized protein